VHPEGLDKSENSFTSSGLEPAIFHHSALTTTLWRPPATYGIGFYKHALIYEKLLILVDIATSKHSEGVAARYVETSAISQMYGITSLNTLRYSP
jgi:hypothetical protein